jgi:hypothetical protein
LNTEINVAYPEEEDLSKYFRCRSCGRYFDSFGDMQRHILTEHVQKGDVP